MSSLIPSPRFGDFCKFLKSGENDFHLWAPNAKQTALPLSFSRNSLKLIVDWYRKTKGVERPVLWIPSYICTEAVESLEEEDVHIRYYKVNEKLAPDFVDCKEKLKGGECDIFLLVHYFGVPSNYKKASNFCYKNKILLVEDATHCLVPNSGIGTVGRFVMYSPYKFFPIPDGALLIANKLGEDESKSLQELYRTIAEEGSSLGWILKELVRFVLMKLKMKFLWQKKASFLDPDIQGKIKNHLALPARISLRYLSHLGKKEIDSLTSKRKSHIDIISDILKSERVKGNCFSSPYGYGYLVSSDQGEEEFYHFHDNGMYASTWPKLPSYVQNEEMAKKWRSSSYIFPIHQNLKTSDFYPFIKKRVNDSYSDRCVLKRVTKEEWGSYFSRIPQSNIVQSYGYGEAKRLQGWTPERYVICINDREIGIVQVLVKKILTSFVSVYRVNRGPLLFEGFNNRYFQFIALEALKTRYGIFKWRPFLISPEIEKIGLGDLILAKSSFMQLGKGQYHSSWIDLRVSVEKLRAQLQSKWRNLLKLAERSEIVVQVSSTEESFSRVMDCYSGLMSEKDFTGTPIDILKSLHLENKEDFLVIEGIKDELIAMILISIHGTSATYHVGWNGEVGRKLNANNLLLWTALLELKKKGISWFDVGGMDEKNLPQITSFKNGLGGQDYHLSGILMS